MLNLGGNLPEDEKRKRDARRLLAFNILFMHWALYYLIRYKMDAVGDAAVTVRDICKYVLQGIGVGLLAVVFPKIFEKFLDLIARLRFGNAVPPEQTKQTITTETVTSGPLPIAPQPVISPPAVPVAPAPDAEKVE